MNRPSLFLMGWVLCSLTAGAAHAADPAGPRQAQLLHLLRHDCGSCHGMTLKGGLGPPLLPSNLAGVPVTALVHAILDGRPGTPMPPWRGQITPAEARWLVYRLKEGLQ